MIEKYKEIFEKALLIRLVENKLLELFNAGKLNGTVHTCTGQELIPVCLSKFLNDKDYILSNHRGHGHLLCRDNDIKGFFAELMGKEDGICGGMGGSQHLFRHNHLSNGIQGGMTPIAAGIALANKIKKNNQISVCFIGDGTLGEGIIYEAFNIASIWNLPVLYIIENNQIAQSTSIKQTMAGSVKSRAEGFGLKYFKTDTWNIDHLLNTLDRAVNITRNDQNPVLLEIDTYRLNSHSKGDDNRDPQEVKTYQSKDLLNKLLFSNDKKIKTVKDQLDEMIDRSVKEAEQSRTLSDLVRNKGKDNKLQYLPVEEENGLRINELIHQAIRNEFETNPNTVMIGEDIEYKTPWTELPYGGAFKVSKDLSEHFSNVKNTPISEAAIIGIGTGLAIEKMKPIVEIMFGDFMTLTFDQIFNHACKFYKMYNRKLPIPLVIRTPMGGKRGYGPTHSQSIEKHFLGINELSIIVLNRRISPVNLYRSIFTEVNPVLVIENKVLYTKKLNTEFPIGFKLEKSNEKYPTVKISPDSKSIDVTVLCYGEILDDVEQAIEQIFEDEEILCEIICPSIINPINIEPIIQSVNNTKSLLILEEGSNIASFSSEVSALLLEKGISLSSYGRLANNDIIPSSYEAEIQILPNTKSIYNKIKEVYYAK